MAAPTKITGFLASAAGAPQNATNPTITAGAACAIGDTLVIVDSINFATTITPVTDSLGNTYTKRATGSSGTLKAEVWSCVSVAAGTPVATLTGTAPGQHRLTYYGLTGADSPSFDVFAQANGAGTTPTSGATATEAARDEFCLGVIHYSVSQTYVQGQCGAGWTIDQSDARTMTMTKTNTGSVTVTADGSGLTTGNWIALAVTFKAPAAGGSFTVAPSGVPSNHSGNITLTLTGSGTTWDGTTVFTPSGVANVTKVSQNVTSATAATVVMTTGAGTGTLTITESVTGSATATTTVGAPSFTRSPTSITVTSTGNVITLTGTNTVWSQDSPTFTLSGGTGASITAQNITTNTAATVTVSAGSASGTNNLTITDPSTGATNTLSVTTSTSILVSDTNLEWLLPGVNWEISGSSYARTSWHGSGARFGFTGTAITMNIDWTGVTADAANLPLIAYAVDGKQWQFHQLVTSDTAFALFSGLANTTHDFEFYVEQLYASATGVGNSYTLTNALKITSFTVDAGPAVAHTQGLRTKKIALFSQSTETGADVLGLSGNAQNSYIRNWSFAWGQGWNVAIGSCAAPSQRLLGTALTGQVKVYDPADVTGSSWNKISSGVTRSFAGLDAVVIFLSGSDFRDFQNLGTPSLASIQAALEGFLGALRGANATMKIIMCVLPNGLGRTQITAAVAARNALGNAITLIDPGARLMYGFDGATPVTNGGVSVYMTEPPHQNEVGGQVEQAAYGPLIYNELFGVSGGGGGSTSRRRRWAA